MVSQHGKMWGHAIHSWMRCGSLPPRSSERVDLVLSDVQDSVSKTFFSDLDSVGVLIVLFE